VFSPLLSLENRATPLLMFLSRRRSVSIAVIGLMFGLVFRPMSDLVFGVRWRSECLYGPQSQGKDNETKG
jgi:hypothetical protein